MTRARPHGVLEIPDVVRNRALAVGAPAWLDGLADLVVHLEHLWAFTTDCAFTDSTEAFVTAVTRDDGAPAVLKLIVPRDHDLARPFSERLDVLVATAMRVWRPAPDCGLRTGAEKGRWLCDFVTRTWEELDRPCTERAVAYAIECASRRIARHDDERAVLVHGDVHEWNALRADGGFKLVDPDGLLAEAEYDLGVMMREDPLELLADTDAHARARRLARRTALDPEAIWEWGVIERVSTGLLATEVGLQPIGRQMLAAADHVAA